MNFISQNNPLYYPKVGDTVKGKSGKQEYKGIVLPSKKNPKNLLFLIDTVRYYCIF